MIVEIPVTITFDHDNPNVPGGPGMSRVFTMRYDTEAYARPASVTIFYPPRKDSIWFQDKTGVLFSMMTGAVDEYIKRKYAENTAATDAENVA